MDAITGFVGFRGIVKLDGRDIGRLPPYERTRLGLARTWQSTDLFDDLDVRENLTVAAGRGTRLDTRESEELGRLLRSFADRGQSTLLIDHDMGLVLSICDRVVVIEFGKVIADGRRPRYARTRA